MGKSLVTYVNPSDIMLENILLIMEKEHFCKDKAAKIVGGVKKLEDLIASGAIQAEKPSNSQNGKWYCNAAQVLRHCKNMRKKVKPIKERER
jgi:hypothetical protein